MRILSGRVGIGRMAEPQTSGKTSKLRAEGEGYAKTSTSAAGCGCVGGLGCGSWLCAEQTFVRARALFGDAATGSVRHSACACRQAQRDGEVSVPGHAVRAGRRDSEYQRRSAGSRSE